MDQQRFKQLWARSAMDGVATAAAAVAHFAVIDRHYHESHRHYHRPAHIAHCLRQFDAARPGMDQPDLVELAIWYHDVVYLCGASDNELQSAELFKAHADGQLSSRAMAIVYDLIMVTIHDQKLPVTLDQEYVVDIDLSSFGLPWEQFLTDSKAVRAEFNHLSDAEFYPGQCRFFDMLLARDNFCFTEFFRQRHELQARENIQRYLQQLSDQGYRTP